MSTTRASGRSSAPADHLDDHADLLVHRAFMATMAPQTCQGKRVKSGSRFSRKASRPSTASSAM